jgi:hypothetical protein
MIKKNFENIFFVEEYAFPKRIGLIDIQSIRNLAMKSIEEGGSDSQYSMNFRNRLDSIVPSFDDSRPFYYIREFIVPITNKERWLRILYSFGLSGVSKYTRQEFFKLDYFFKYTGLAVEIDSNLHDSIYDAARDEYLRTTYGLETIRIQGFSKDSDIRSFKDHSLKIFNNKTVKESTFIMSRELYAVESYYNVINTLIENNYNNFYKEFVITLSKKDFYEKFGKYSLPDCYEGFVYGFERTFKEKYNKIIKWID